MVHGSWFMAVWLTQQQMAELFNTTRNNITLHIGNIFKEGELEVNSVRKESLLTAADGTNEEYISGPIITGLKKTDKISCSPYDCYHGNLYKALYGSNALVIVGYSFGDLYVNNLIRMMHTLYGDKKRIVIIDKWNQKTINSESGGLEKYIQAYISPQEVTFWQMMAGCTSVGELIDGFLQDDVMKVMVSKNGCLMILADGFKAAVGHKTEIEAFLGS